MRTTRMTTRRLMALVVAVAVVMVGVLFVLGVGESKARAECRNHLVSISLSLHNYHQVNGLFPPGTVPNPGLPPSRRLSWMVFIFQMLEQGLSLVIELLSPWDSPGNRTPLFLHTSTDGIPPPSTSSAADPWLLCCSEHAARKVPNGPAPSDYVGVAGLGTDAPELSKGHVRAGVFGYDRQTSIGDITDGASNTMMIAETALAQGPWIAGGPATVRGLDPARTPYLGRGRQFGGTHRGGAMVAFADGSVRFLNESIDPKVFEALSTVVGGESLPVGWDR